MEKDMKIITKAPGKVLISGGYGVLEENNFGLTLALNSYFYCICTQHTSQHPLTQITVNSYQIEQYWHYVYNTQSKSIKEVDGKVNVFVQNAIRWTLFWLEDEIKFGKVVLELVFSRNFISNKDAIDEQNEFPIYKKGYNKTGLGSSACVVVSIVKCLIKLFIQQKKIQISDINRVVNVICQVANLSAQKKIGSNFDISTAVYGSHLYKNILPHQISNFIHSENNNGSKLNELKKLLEVDSQVNIIMKLSINYYSYIIDINKGADTRVMVKSFTSQLKKCNQNVQREFFDTSKQITLNLYEAITKGQTQKCRQINVRHRKLQQKYSQITGVPVEPKDLTPLIDSIMEIEGTIYAICPGSGGYDAIFVLATQNICGKLKNTIGNHNMRQVTIQLGEINQLNEIQRDKVLKIINNIYKYK